MSIDAGAFMRGLARGMMAAQQMRERQEAKEEQKAAQRRDLRLRFQSDLLKAPDLDTFEQVRGFYKSAGRELGIEPEFDLPVFPESKRKQLAIQKAQHLWNTLVQRNDFEALWERNASVQLDDGESVTVRELAKRINFPLPKVTVREPITEEVPAPRTEEGSLGRFLAPAGSQMIQVGTQEREEELPPFVPAQVRTLGQWDPQTFAKHPHLARIPLPIDPKTGQPDGIKLLAFYKAAGVVDPTETTKKAQERVDKDRIDYDRRLGRIQQKMNQDKTEVQFRASVQAYNSLVTDFRRHKPWVGAKELPVDVPTAVKQWRRAQATTAGATVGDAMDVPGTAGEFEVRSIRNKQGVVTHFAVNGQQFTVQQVREAAQRMLLDADPAGVELALKVGISRGQVLRWLDAEMRRLGAKTGMTGDPDASRKLAELTRLRSQALAGRSVTTAPALVPGREPEPEPTDLEEFYK